MTRQEIEDEVKEVVGNQLELEKDENGKWKIKPEDLFVDDLGADSLDRVGLIMALEEKLKIEIPDVVGEKIKTVYDAVKFIELHNARGT